MIYAYNRKIPKNKEELIVKCSTAYMNLRVIMLHERRQIGPPGGSVG